MLREILAAMVAVLFICPSDNFKPMHATAYCLDGIMANGEEVHDGACASSLPELFGETIELYQRRDDGTIGAYIGTYEVKDTGCKETVIDVWCVDLAECQAFMDKVYKNGCHGQVYVYVISEDGQRERREDDMIENELSEIQRKEIRSRTRAMTDDEVREMLKCVPSELLHEESTRRQLHRDAEMHEIASVLKKYAQER